MEIIRRMRKMANFVRHLNTKVAEGVASDPHDFTADISRETNQIIESWNHTSLTKTCSQLTAFSYRNISTCHLCIY